MVTSRLIITIAARIDLAKDASRILIRLSQIFHINMAFAAYVMENAILFFSPGWQMFCKVDKEVNLKINYSNRSLLGF